MSSGKKQVHDEQSETVSVLASPLAGDVARDHFFIALEHSKLWQANFHGPADQRQCARPHAQSWMSWQLRKELEVLLM